jgi:hypothetical protein
MIYTRDYLLKLAAQNLYGLPNLEKYLRHVLNDNGPRGPLVSVSVPGPLTEELCARLTRLIGLE